MPVPRQPTFSGVHFWVRDMAAAVLFYRMCGLAVPEGAEGGEFTRIELPGGQTFELGTHGLTRRYHPDFDPPPPGAKGATVLQFVVESREAVDSLHTKLVGAGYRGHLAPIDAFWGARYAEVLDPDGNAVGFHGREATGNRQ